MQWLRKLLPLLVLSALTAGCATVTPPPQRVEAPVSRAQQQKAQAESAQPQKATLKRKIAIGRFTNETTYGRTLFRDADLNPLGKQAADMLAARLVQSGEFMVFERPEISKIKAEQRLDGGGNLVGVDTLIVGSVTQFGRSVTGKSGFLSSTKRQTAHAKVEARLVDVHTGLVFFAASGAGTAQSEAGQIAGYGSKAGYDATLNDKAIGAAISDLVTNIMNKLAEREWRTDILSVKGNIIFISGGQSQGLKKGQVLVVKQRGDTIKSKQTGMQIELPGTEIAKIKITGFFGTGEYAEGSTATIVAGKIPNQKLGDLYVVAQ